MLTLKPRASVESVKEAFKKTAPRVAFKRKQSAQKPLSIQQSKKYKKKAL